jgi:hypothetical protein
MTHMQSYNAPWSYQYSPYTAQDGHEIPAFEVLDDTGEKVFDTNENTPSETQETAARLAAAAPELLDHLSELCRITGQFLDGKLVTFPVQTLLAAESALCRAAGAKAKGGAA